MKNIKNIWAPLSLLFKIVVIGLSFFFIGRISSLKEGFRNFDQILNLPSRLNSILTIYNFILIGLALGFIFFLLSLFTKKSFKALTIVEIIVNIISLISYIIAFIIIRPVIKAIKILSKSLSGLDKGEMGIVIENIINQGSFLIEKVQGPLIAIFRLMIIISAIILFISLILLLKRMLARRR